jgi:hypothetical protein
MKQQKTFPTLDQVWLFAALILIGLRPLLTAIPPNDFWWHMATGRMILDTGTIPQIDSFSYTQAGETFFNQSWLSQVLLYGLYSIGGAPLLLMVQSFVLAATYWLILKICLWHTNNVKLSVSLLLLTTLPLSFDNWIIRPQSYTFLLFAAFLAILSAYRLGRFNRLWLLPILMLLWVNLHGSFVLGGVLIGATFVCEWLKQFMAGLRTSMRPNEQPNEAYQPPLMPLFLTGVVSALALLINPRGFGVLGYVGNLLSSSSVTTLVTEWAPPTIRETNGLIFFLFLFLCIAVLAYSRRAPDFTDMLLAAMFLWLALGAVRNIVWFGMIATPLLAKQIATFFPQSNSPRKSPAGLAALNWALVAVLCLLYFLGLPWIKTKLDLPPAVGALYAEATPIEAVACMQAQPERSERLFHEMGYGSYLIWQTPEQKVFIDPRIELYPYGQWVDYINLSAGNNVEALIEKYRFDGMLLDTTSQSRLIDALETHSNWRIVCSNEQSVFMLP